jgi:hypothetical protein
MKPMLKAPGTKRLKEKNDELLLNFAFNSNLRRYTAVAHPWQQAQLRFVGGLGPRKAAGAYTRPLFSST